MVQLQPCERFFSFDESIKLKLNIFTEKEKKHKQITIKEYISFISALGFDTNSITTKLAVKRIKLTDSINCTIDEINWLKYWENNKNNNFSKEPILENNQWRIKLKDIFIKAD